MKIDKIVRNYIKLQTSMIHQQTESEMATQIQNAGQKNNFD